jgi:hypothetical protein
MNIRMHAKIYLIIKVFDDKNTLKLMVDKNKYYNLIPVLECKISTTEDIRSNFNLFLSENNIPSSWVQDIKNIGFEIIDGDLHLFYTTLIPKDFIDDKIVLKELPEVVSKYYEAGRFFEEDAVYKIILNKIHTAFASYTD